MRHDTLKNCGKGTRWRGQYDASAYLDSVVCIPIDSLTELCFGISYEHGRPDREQKGLGTLAALRFVRLRLRKVTGKQLKTREVSVAIGKIVQAAYMQHVSFICSVAPFLEVKLY